MDFSREFRFKITDAGFYLMQGKDDEFLMYGVIAVYVLEVLETDANRHLTRNFRVDKLLWDLRGITPDSESFNKYSKLVAEYKKPFDAKDFLNKIVSDREGFIRELPHKSLALDNAVSANFLFDGKKSYAQYSANSIVDMLYLDMCKVVETGVYIKRCPVCNCYFRSKKKTAKWCPLCRKSANAKAKQTRMKENPCAMLHKNIVDRLRRRCSIKDAEKSNARYKALNSYIKIHDELKESASEQELLNWLREQDEATKRKPF